MSGGKSEHRQALLVLADLALETAHTASRREVSLRERLRLALAWMDAANGPGAHDDLFGPVHRFLRDVDADPQTAAAAMADAVMAWLDRMGVGV